MLKRMLAVGMTFVLLIGLLAFHADAQSDWDAYWETVKGDNNVKYRCMKLSYLEWSEKKNKYRQYATFFVTDDSNHVPVRIDITLNFGEAKAYVATMKGTRNPITSIVK